MKTFKICDTHNDFLTELPLSQIPSYLNICKKDGVKTICSSYFSSQKNQKEIKAELPLRAETLQNWNKQNPDLQALLHCEDLWWVKTEADLKFLLSLKPFSASLTWNFQNALAGGAKSQGNLTPWGKHVAEKLLQNNVLLDFSHLNRKSFWQLCEICQNNIFCSHSGFCAIKNHPRNLSLKQIEKIIQSEGYIGLFFFDKCISKNIKNKQNANSNLLNDVVQNIKFFTSRFGIDNLGIGSDFFGISNLPENLNCYNHFSNLALSLYQNNFSKSDIQKLFGQNFKSFLQRKKGV